MKRYVDKNDLDMINEILDKGEDVRISKTSFTVRIISEKVHVHKKKEVENIKDYAEM